MKRIFIPGLVVFLTLCIFGKIIVNSNTLITKADTTSLSAADSGGTPILSSTNSSGFQPEGGDGGDGGGPPGPGRG